MSILLILAFSGCVSVSEKKFRKAQESFNRGDYDVGLKHCYESLEEDVSNENALKLFPQLFDKVYKQQIESVRQLEETENWDAAVDKYARITAMNERTTHIWELLKKKEKLPPNAETVIALKLENVDSAKSMAYEKAAEGHYIKGNTYGTENEFRKAEEEFNITLSFVADYKDAKALANEYKQKADEQDAEIHYQKGVELANSQNYRQASEEFYKVLPFVPGYKDSEALAIEYKQKADEQDAEIHYQKGVELANSQNYRQASEEFKKALPFVPGYKDSEALAIEYKQKADEQDAEIHYQKGVELANSQNYRQASEEFKKALPFVPGYKDSEALAIEYKQKANEQDAEIHYQQGVSNMKYKKYMEALNEFQKAHNYIPAYKDTVQLIEVCQKSMPPTEDIVAQAVRAELKNKVPFSWVNTLGAGSDAKLKIVQIQKIGIFNEKNNYWPMKIRVAGNAIDGNFVAPKRVSFDKIADFRLYRNDYGDWQAHLVGGTMQ